MGKDDKKVFIYLGKPTYQRKMKNNTLRFKHNRLNMIFLIGQAVYFHTEHIITFLQSVHGTNNDLFKAVLLDCKEPL